MRYYEGMRSETTVYDILGSIRDAIVAVLRSDDFGINLESVGFTVEHPDNVEHGEYASNVALIVGKMLGRSPREFAEGLQKKLSGTITQVERIEVAGPGFLNFYLSRDFFSEQIVRACMHGDAWGKSDSEKGQEVLFEYTSPNLFKPLHIGNLVGNIVGESIARLFEMHGAAVRRINYPSDIGLTVAKGVWGLQKTGGDSSAIEALGEAYRVGNDAYENDAQSKQEIESVNQKLYAGNDSSLQDIWERGKKTSLSHLTDLCCQLGTKFDMVIFESEVGDAGLVLVRDHIADGVFEEDDGAVVFRGEKDGLHTRVFVNSQGLPTYEAKDLGNFMRKQEGYPKWSRSVVVTGSEQREYFQVLLQVIRAVFHLSPEKTLEHIATGFLTLSTGKMSSRKGNVLTGESLFADLRKEALVRAKETRADDVQTLSEHIAVAAVKYQILRRTVGSDIVFTVQQAFSFEGDSGPYLQYTYARCMSVLQKAEAVGVLSPEAPQVSDTVYPIERYIYRFSEAITVALKKRSPHHLVSYLTELSGMFNSFYANERIADSEDPFSPYKVMITQAVAHTLKNGLWALGIEAPERM